MQYAQHIKLGDIDVDAMRALRTRSVQDMADTAISQAQAYFAGKPGKSASQATEDAEPDFARAGGDN
jgi:hypothetical protein